MDNEYVRTVRLYGSLGAKFGRVHRLAVRSASEASLALCALLPGFEAYLMSSKDRGEGYAVFYDQENIGKDSLDNPAGHSEIRFAPMVLGAKRAGVFQIVLGAILVVVGVLLSPYTGGTSMYLAQAGYGLIAGGIVQLLTPMPKGLNARDRPENTPSAVFNGAVNTQAQGNPVPVLYGELIVGSAVISAGINAVDQAIAPSNTARIGGGGGGWSSRLAEVAFEEQ